MALALACNGEAWLYVWSGVQNSVVVQVSPLFATSMASSVLQFCPFLGRRCKWLGFTGGGNQGMGGATLAAIFFFEEGLIFSERQEVV